MTSLSFGGFKWYTEKNPCRVRLICADGKSPIIPEGYGAAMIPANNAEGCVPIKCYYTPDIPNFMLSPNSFKPLLGKHYNGYAVECNDDKKTFHFSVNHKKCKSGSLLYSGRLEVVHATRGLRCPQCLRLKALRRCFWMLPTISMVEDHPKNSHQHELKLHALSAKAERLLWHQ